MSERADLNYYQRNRDEILKEAKENYENNKERLREQARDKYRNLKKKKIKRENMEKNRYCNMSEGKKQRLKEYQKNYC